MSNKLKCFLFKSQIMSLRSGMESYSSTKNSSGNNSSSSVFEEMSFYPISKHFRNGKEIGRENKGK